MASPLLAIVLIAVSAAAIAKDALLKDVAADVGLRFRHTNGAAGRYYLPEIMGSGGGLFDYDGDGDLDVMCLDGGPLNRMSSESAPS